MIYLSIINLTNPVEKHLSICNNFSVLHKMILMIGYFLQNYIELVKNMIEFIIWFKFIISFEYYYISNFRFN